MFKGVLNINPMVRKLLHYISMCGTFFVLFSVIFLIQKYTIGIIFSLNMKYVYGIPLDFIIFTPTTIILILKYFKISSPYTKD